MQHLSPRKRILQVQFVNPPHKRQRRIGDGPRLVVHCRLGELPQLALPPDRQWMSAINHRFALSKPIEDRSCLVS
jgi:hypothetical protein